jgi:hypothetical protein
MACCAAKLKISGDKASPCFRQFLIENASDKCLPIQTLLYVLFEHIFINLPSFIGISNSEDMIQKLSHNWIIAFVEVCKELMYCRMLFPFFRMCLTNAEYMIGS